MNTFDTLKDADQKGWKPSNKYEEIDHANTLSHIQGLIYWHSQDCCYYPTPWGIQVLRLRELVHNARELTAKGNAQSTQKLKDLFSPQLVNK
jgi:hypothetical protein